MVNFNDASFDGLWRARIEGSKGSPTFIALQLFKTILEAEDQSNELDMPDQKPRSIRLNLIVKEFPIQPNL